MSFVSSARAASAHALLALAIAGCASLAATHAPKAALSAMESAAVDSARRDERQKLMQEYWYEHAVASSDPEDRAGAGGTPPLLYPAGNYGGLNFASRQAPDPSLSEPVR